MKKATMRELLQLKRKLDKKLEQIDIFCSPDRMDRILDYVDDTWFGFLANENIPAILKRHALEWF